MPDEQTVEQTTEETQETQVEETQTEETQTEASEATGESEEQSQTEETQEGTAEESNPLIIRAKVDGEDREYDLNDPEVRAQVQETLSKGYDYTKKLQRIADFEKANEGLISLGRAVTQDPMYLKASIAQQMGYDPGKLYATPQPPPEWLKTENPEGYADALADHREHTRMLEVVNRATDQATRSLAQKNNELLFERARLQYELSPDEYARVTNYVSTKIQPGQNGLYENDDVKSAYWALFGERRSGQQKLETSENIRKTIKGAVQESGARKPVSSKPQILKGQKKEDREFLDFVKDVVS